MLRDDQGREYIDGNTSIWTNLHGHRHPKMDAALRAQLDKIAHSSFLGLTNGATRALPKCSSMLIEWTPDGKNYRVFLSDDGSTAIEAGLKMILQARDQRGEAHRKNFVSLSQGYHGDTVGAMSLGHSKILSPSHFSAVLFPPLA